MSETERLINAVRGYPLLYNTSHADYKNLRKREEAWYNISESFQDKYDVEWKKKWKNLKDSYAKYLKAEHAKTPKENLVLRRYKSWPWASQMEFVRPFFKFNKQSESNSKSTEKQWFDLPDGIFSEDSLKGFPEDEVLDPCEEQMEIKHVQPSYQDEEFLEQEIQHIDVDSLRFDSKEDKPQSKAASTKRLNSNSKQSDIELILMGYAKTIKTFSPKRQTMVKFKFSQILMEAELAQQEEEDESNGPSAKKKLKNRDRRSPLLSYESSN